MAYNMRFAWAKSYLPRSLYGRAALILLVPVVALQLVVSIVFIQRHYAGVTQQMSRNVALELRYVLEIVESAPTSDEALQQVSAIATGLAFKLDLPATAPTADMLGLLDFSGRAMRETFRKELPNPQRFDMTQNREVWVWLQTRYGVMSAVFDRRRVSASNPHQLLVLMGVTSVFLTLIAFVFLRNQLRPIKRLARASEAFGKGQIRAYRPSGATEVRAAGNAFLDMRSRIERQIEQRTMMLSGISHDLRTPLTRMRLALSLQDETQETQDMLRDVADMERLISEFLAFARGDSLDDPERVDPAQLVRSVVEKFAESGAPVTYCGVNDVSQTTLRPMAIARASENLIGNALKYGSQCRVSLELEGQIIRISVEDNGPGIPGEMRDDALKPFVRLDAARNQNQGGGVGLGLAIAHDIARRHGGSLLLGESLELGGLKADLVLPR